MNPEIIPGSIVMINGQTGSIFFFLPICWSKCNRKYSKWLKYNVSSFLEAYCWFLFYLQILVSGKVKQLLFLWIFPLKPVYLM